MHCSTDCVICPGVTNGFATCVSGTCGLACNSMYHLCSGTCYLVGDPMHCGPSCLSCPAPANGRAVCVPGGASVGGTCGVVCDSGYTNCSGSCVDLRNDPNNCGHCGTRCSTRLCVAGLCA
jgi:hypothetical protein